MRSWCLFILLGCGTAAPQPKPPEPSVAITQELPPKQARRDLAVGDTPMSIAIVGTSLVWTDSAGSIWTMASDGSEPPRQLSDQKLGYAFSLVVAGDRVFASTKKDLLRVELPNGPVTHAGIRGLADNPEQLAGDPHFIYCTMFKRNEIVSVPIGGGAAQKLFELPRGVLGIHGATLYAASYSTGVLVAIPTGGAPSRTIARGIPRPTAVAADDNYAFVYSERDKSVRRIALANGNTVTIATQLENSDDLVSDGAWLYTFSWAGKHGQLLRIGKNSPRPPQILADDLASPYHLFVDDEAIYVTSRDQNKIVRFEKSALGAD